MSELKFKKQEDVIEFTKKQWKEKGERTIEKIDKEHLQVSIPSCNLTVNTRIFMNKDGFGPIHISFKNKEYDFNPITGATSNIPQHLQTADYTEEELHLIANVLNDIVKHWIELSKKIRKEPFFVVGFEPFSLLVLKHNKDFKLLEEKANRLMEKTMIQKVDKGKEKVEMFRKFRFQNQEITYDQEVLDCIIGIYEIPNSKASQFFKYNLLLREEIEEIRKVFPEVIVEDVSATRERFSSGHAINEFLNVRGKLLRIEFYKEKFEFELLFDGKIKVDVKSKQNKQSQESKDKTRQTIYEIKELMTLFEQIERENRHTHLFAETVKKANFERLVSEVFKNSLEIDLEKQFEKLLDLVDLPIDAERLSAQFIQEIQTNKENVLLNNVGKFIIYEFVAEKELWHLIIDKSNNEMTFMKSGRQEAKKEFLKQITLFVDNAFENK